MRLRRRLPLSLAAFAALTVCAWLGFGRWVAVTELPPLAPETSVEVLAKDGRLLRAYTVANGRWRLAAATDEVDPTYLRMLLAYEDRRFFRHHGVDLRALARALYQNVAGGRRVSGGSTLTMQVARLLEDGTTGSWSGKLRQLRVALALERRLSKREILGLYLDLAPMGGNLEGVRAGSFAWFGKEPSRLTAAESALLVALPQAPAARTPDEHPEAARAARDRVLTAARQAGVLSRDEAVAAASEGLPGDRRAFPRLAPHLADRLRNEDPAARLHRTTIDADLQIGLEALALGALVNLPAHVTVALLVADQDSGEVLASVGSADYTSLPRDGFVDMTQALRSPGSTLKPLVYGLAFSDGLAHPETLLNDRPEDYGGYAPQNFDGFFRGPVTAREALQASLNLPVVAITKVLGPARLLAALRRAGVTAVVPGDAPGLAVALGGVGVSLEGLVQVYAAIARGGEVRALSVRAGEAGSPTKETPEAAALAGRQEATPPLGVRVAEMGSPVGNASGAGASAVATAVDASSRVELGSARLMSAQAAWQVADVLAGAPRAGGLPDGPLAVKTGTSSGNRDAWALGFDGAHVAGVWVGRADGSPVPGMVGAEVATPLLFEVFARLGRGVPLPPAPPGTLSVATNAALPAHLRRFGRRQAEVDDDPRLVFPPDGAVLTPLPSGLPARVERGTAPFTWFANGAPMLQGSYERDVRLAPLGRGFVTLSVLDSEGRSARVAVEVR